MNLLHVTPYYAPAWTYGGVVRAVTDLTQALSATGHTVLVLTTDTLDRSRRTAVLQERIGEVQVIRVRNQSNMLRAHFNLSTPIHFGKIAHQLIREYSIDLVHCHELRTVENLCIMQAVGESGLPLVVSPHGTLTYRIGRGKSKQLWDRIFGKSLMSRFDQVVALTASEAQEVMELWARQQVSLRRDQVCTVPNGIFPEEYARLPSANRFRRQWALGKGPVAIFIGRLAERKGLQLLLPAFADATEHIPGARLLIIGPDEHMRPELDRQVEKFDLAERVVFTGLLTGNDKMEALAASDLFVLPAVGEGFSMAALEAMACGLPVILSKDCHFPEAAEAGAGLVISREESALREALHGLLLDGKLRTSMGGRARQLVRTRYSWSQVVAQLEGVYEKAARHLRQSKRD